MELELRTNNLFSNGFITEFKEGDMMLERDPIVYVGQEKDKYHTVSNNDRLDILAWKYYGNQIEDASKYWWIIADVNEIMNPLDLSEYIGKKLLIPSLEKILLAR